MFNLPIKLFVDCAHPGTIAKQAEKPYISGFTTNPTLMRREGVTNYAPWAKSVIHSAGGKPVSFEVLADDLGVMHAQARLIASWGENVYVKIPITNTKGQSTAPVIWDLAQQGVAVNVTAVTTIDQVCAARDALIGAKGIISIFAGRIADTGKDPMRVVNAAVDMAANFDWIKILWASTREVYNILQADQVGCHIITVTPEILAKLPLLGKDLDELSLETVKQFYDDAVAAGYSL